MNRQFIESVCWRGVYEVSPYTKSSYYASSLVRNFDLANDSERRKAMKESIRDLVASGEVWLLPHRIGVLVGDQMASVSGSGRASNPMDAQLKASFTKVEDSPYKQFKPYEVQTGLWRCVGERSLFYGSLGVTGSGGRVERDNGDLLLVRTTDWKRLEVFIFKGLAGVNKQLDCLPEVVEFVKGL